MGRPNIKEIAEEIVSEYDFAYLGRLFSEVLYNNQIDRVAFTNYLDYNSLRNVQSEVISNVKSRLDEAAEFEYNFIDHDFSKIELKQENSLLGSIKEIVTEEGEDAFEDIGMAVMRGSKKYISAVPLAKYYSVDQFKEYRNIKRAIDRLF